MSTKVQDQTQRGHDAKGNPTSTFVPGGARSLSPRVPTPLAPFPGTRTADDEDHPFSVTPREGEDVPPVMITQDVSSPGRTVSTNFIPGEYVDPPVTPPGGGEGEVPDPVDTTVAIDSPTLLALSTQPKLLVPITAGDSLEFQGATGAFTYGTTPYVGTGNLQIKCGGTVVSNDVPVSALTGSASGDLTFTPLPGITLQADQPITLVHTGGSLTGGDGTLSIVITTATHAPNAGATRLANSDAQADYDRNSRDERARAAARGTGAPHEVGRIGRMVERGERHSESAKHSGEHVEHTSSRVGETHPSKKR